MTAGQRPEHCKGCLSLHTAGRSKPSQALKKYNAWCCQKGDRADKAIGWCKQTNAKRTG